MTSHPHPGRIRAPSAKHVVPAARAARPPAVVPKASALATQLPAVSRVVKLPKILARGEITAKVNVHAHGASAAAVSAIEAAGGSVTLITLPFMEEGKAGRPAVQGNQFANR